MDAVVMQGIFKALAHRQRLRIYMALVRAEDGLTRSELLTDTRIKKAVFTIHLEVLVKTGLVKVDPTTRVVGDFATGVKSEFRCRALVDPLVEALAAITSQ